MDARPKKDKMAAPVIVQHQPMAPTNPNEPEQIAKTEAVIAFFLGILFQAINHGLHLTKRNCSFDYLAINKVSGCAGYPILPAFIELIGN